MGIYILFEKTQLSEAFIVRSLSQRGTKKQETNFTSRSQDDLLAWHKRYLLKYLNYLGPGQLSPCHRSRPLTSGHSTRVRPARESGHWGTAERTSHSRKENSPSPVSSSHSTHSFKICKAPSIEALHFPKQTGNAGVDVPAASPSCPGSGGPASCAQQHSALCLGTPGARLHFTSSHPAQGSHYSLILFLACSKQPVLTFPQKATTLFSKRWRLCPCL